MADVFISYKSERRKAAEHLAKVLECYGYSVWFDYRLIRGRDFRSQIEAEVHAAKAIVVLWCTLSVKSEWVREEAGLAHRLDRLIPVKIEVCELPFGFAYQDTLDLSAWDAAPQGEQLYPLLDALEQKVGRIPVPDYKKLREYEQIWRRFKAPSLRTFALEDTLELTQGERNVPVGVSVTAPTLGVGAGPSRSPLSDAAVSEAVALEHWQAIKGRGNRVELAAFIADFGSSKCARLARDALERAETEAFARLGSRPDKAALQRFLAEGWDGASAAKARSQIEALRQAEERRTAQAKAKAANEAAERQRKAAAREAGKQAWRNWLSRNSEKLWAIGAFLVLAIAIISWLFSPDREKPRIELPAIDDRALQEAAMRAVVKERISASSERADLLDFLRQFPGERPVIAARLVSLGYVQVDTPAGQRWLRPGGGKEPPEPFNDCSIGESACPEMVVVPAGSFMMGSPTAEKGRADDEGPQHQVTIAKPFAVVRFEVTFDEWQACVDGGGCTANKSPDDRGWGKGNRPVINVSWNDAKEYTGWLSRRTGKTYRLLSEAEWEYAARAGTSTAYWWGDDIGKNNANCIGCGSQWDGKQTAPVGSFAANAFGLYDVHGNVWEWAEDCSNGNYNGAPADGSAWTTGDCGVRVLRGGSWSDSPGNLRSAVRDRDPPDVRIYIVGFRVARTL